MRIAGEQPYNPNPNPVLQELVDIVAGRGQVHHIWKLGHTWAFALGALIAGLIERCSVQTPLLIYMILGC